MSHNLAIPQTDAERELAAHIARYAITEGLTPTAVPGLTCIRLSRPNLKLPAVYNPSVCFVVQGSKQVMLESEVYHYGSGQYFAVSIDVPVLGQVLQASPQTPYLCIQLDLNAALITDLAAAGATAGQGASTLPETRRGIFVGPIGSPLLDAVLRMARLLDAPADIPVLAPLLAREVHYHLLRGPHGPAIAQMAVPGTSTHKIAQVIRHMNGRLAEPLSIPALATLVNMSESSLHAHFKAVTSLSPGQYHKRLRLTQARQLMLMENLDATTTAYKVGYESPSHFSREYARLFGHPPMRDITLTRQALAS